jgi:2'-5' RNA ligase
VLGKALALHDRETRSALLYLVPVRGSQAIVELHDRLYAGLLLSARRRDLPYIPHVTIGRFAEFGKAEAAAAMLNGQGLHVQGLAAEIEIVSIDAPAATRIARIELAG